MKTQKKHNDNYTKCSGCMCLRHNDIEFEIYKGKQRKTCLVCKQKRVEMKIRKVEHKVEESKLDDCIDEYSKLFG